MGSTGLGFDVVYRGEELPWIQPGSYVFFQRLKEYGGGFWLGQVYDDWFGFVIERPVSLSEGMELLSEFKREEAEFMTVHDSPDDFVLRSD